MREVGEKHELSEVSSQGLIVPFGKPPLNAIRRLEQVPREFSKVLRILWDSDEYRNMCTVGKS